MMIAESQLFDIFAISVDLLLLNIDFVPSPYRFFSDRASRRPNVVVAVVFAAELSSDLCNVDCLFLNIDCICACLALGEL